MRAAVYYRQCIAHHCHERHWLAGSEWGCELGLNFARCSERGLIQRVESLSVCAWCISRIDAPRVLLVLRSGVLFVCVRLDQTGINRHALTADQRFFNAARHRRHEQMPEQLTLAETVMPVLEKVA